MTSWVADGLIAHAGAFRLGPVDLSVEGSGTVAVIGRSGAGKTTLLRALAGLTGADGGTVRCDGADVTRQPPERRGVGYVPQGLGLFPHRSVERNVRYSIELSGVPGGAARAEEFLVRFGLGALRRRYPRELSTGEQQRVAVARALVARPRLLLWDEPLTSLDVAARDDLLEILGEVRATDRLPIVLVTHDASIAYSLADRLIVLSEGAVRYSGGTAGLLERPTDPFVARFLGYENVYPSDRLTPARASPLGAYLDARAGPEGVCFSARAVTPRAAGGTFHGFVERVAPTSDGLRVGLNVEGLSVELADASNGASPRPGDRLGFDLNGDAVRPIGPTRPGAG